MSERKSRRFKRGMIIVALLLSLVAIAIVFYRSKEEKAERRRKVSLGLPQQPSEALMILALKNRYFEDHGLDVTVNRYPSGKRALNNGLFAGKDDIVGSAEMPVAVAALSRSDFRILATIFSCGNVNSIVARKDSGILKKEDLAGKRIGTQKNSAVHYFLDLFCDYNNIPLEQIDMVFMKAEELPAALADGRLDAFSMREPYVGEAREKLKGNAVIFTEPDMYLQMEVVVVNESFRKQHPETVRRFLQALIDAEEFVQENPDEAIRIVAEELGINPSAIKQSQGNASLTVSIGHTLVQVLEAEARWAMLKENYDAEEMPNLLNLISVEELLDLKLSAVNLTK